MFLLRTHLTLMVIACATLSILTPGPVSGQALTGVCYATLGNNGSPPGALITIDVATGVGTLIGETGITGEFGDTGVPALAVTNSGELFAMDIGSASNLYQLDPTTGEATFVAATTLSSPPAIAFDGANVLWAVDNTGALYHLDSTTGMTNLVGESGAFIKGLAFDPTDGTLWGSDASSNLYTLDLHTGVATLVGNTGMAPSADIHFDEAGVLYGSSGGGLSANNLITIDKSTGAGTMRGAIGFTSVAGLATRLDRIVPTAIQYYHASWTPQGIEIRWRLADIVTSPSFLISRSVGHRRLEHIPDAGNHVAQRGSEFIYTNSDVQPGTTYRYQVTVLEEDTPVSSFTTSIDVPGVALTLGANYPDPFSPVTRIPFSIAKPARVTLTVFDVSGRRVRSVIDRAMPAGAFVEAWDGRGDDGTPLAAGVYFYRLTVHNRSLTRKAVLVR